MSTSALIRVLYENEIRIAQYCHQDGYMDHTGSGILNFLREYDLSKFKEQCLKTSFLTHEQLQDQQKCYFEDHPELIGQEKYNSLYRVFPYLDPDLNHDILDFVFDSSDNIINLEDYREFYKSSNCEYCYTIDLDTGRFTTEKNKKNICVYNLNELPSEETYIKYDF